MRKPLKAKITHILGYSCALSVLFYFSVVTLAWAKLPFIKSQDTGTFATAERSDMPDLTSPEMTDSQPRSSARAPEPSTIALFGGGGLLSYLIRMIRRSYLTFKRGFDIFAAILGIILTSPLSLLAVLIIKLSSKGPIIYRQTRMGLNGKFFEIYKFRTMKVDAEKHTGPVWAQKNDNRLIPGGRLLRKTRIDELPQFFNILQGDMSLIGPRPERPIFVNELKSQICDYEKRMNVKPGITGLAQVWHKYDETIADVRKKIKYDLLYIKKMCFWTDMRILFRTVRVVLTGYGAH